MDWRTRRQLLTILVLIIFAGVVATGVYFLFLHERATCNDGKQNGAETGVDCGGVCAVVCRETAVPLKLVFSSAFEVASSTYNSVAVLENKNDYAGAVKFTYKLTLNDANGVIAERSGVSNVPVLKKFAIFESGIDTKGRVPTETTFEIIKEPVWRRDLKREARLSYSIDPLARGETNPIVNARVKNEDVFESGKLGFTVMIYDDAGTPLALSHTTLDNLGAGSELPISFTWPKGYDLGVHSCSNDSATKIESFLGDVMLTIDRSGSMSSLGLKPPQPLTAVKEAAAAFASFLMKKDRGGIVSFANEATLDKPLSSNVEEIVSSIGSIAIGTVGGLQQTNLGDGILKAFEELQNSPDEKSKKSIVLLTDGEATRPLLAGDPEYASKYAKEIADTVRRDGVEMYIIGLGKEVNASYLKTLAVNEEAYYPAGSSKDLLEIYNKIAISICKHRPAVIEILGQHIGL